MTSGIDDNEPQIEFWSSNANSAPAAGIEGRGGAEGGGDAPMADGGTDAPSIEFFESSLSSGRNEVGSGRKSEGEEEPAVSWYTSGGKDPAPAAANLQSVSEVDDVSVKDVNEELQEEERLYKEATAFEGAAIVSMIERGPMTEGEEGQKALEITMEDGVTLTVELDSGEKRLIELGYKQELKRVLNFFQLYSVAISSMSVFAGIVPIYPQGFMNGGPVGLIWYWWISAFFVHLVGFSFAEISSSFPTAGSLYFWAAALAGPRLAPAVSFFTAWLEFIGLSVGLSGVAYAGVSNVLSQLIYMCTGYSIDEYTIFGMAFFITILCAAINLLPIRVVANVLVVSAIWQILGGIVTAVAVPWVATKHQTASFVFGYHNDYREYTMTPSGAYSFLLALIVSQYSLYGYDGVCHLAEETKRSDRTAPMAIMASISTISILGWLVLVAITFSIQDVDALMTEQPNAPGSWFLQIIWDAFYSRYQSGLGAKILSGVIYGSFFFGCIAGLVGASRVCFSLARDNGLPFSRIWKRVNQTTGVPQNAVMLSISIGMAFLLPLLGTPTIFFGLNSIASIGWVGAYATPIFFRLIQREADFCPGPFYMADYIGVTGGKIVHGVAFLWVLYTVFAFALPLTFPITAQTLNWAPVAIVSCVLLLLLWWVVDARYWFKGPLKRTMEAEAAQLHEDFHEELDQKRSSSLKAGKLW